MSPIQSWWNRMRDSWCPPHCKARRARAPPQVWPNAWPLCSIMLCTLLPSTFPQQQSLRSGGSFLRVVPGDMGHGESAPGVEGKQTWGHAELASTVGLGLLQPDLCRSHVESSHNCSEGESISPPALPHAVQRSPKMSTVSHSHSHKGASRNSPSSSTCPRNPRAECERGTLRDTGAEWLP